MTKVVEGSVVEREPNTISLLGYTFLYFVFFPVNQGVPIYFYLDSLKVFLTKSIQIIPVRHSVEAHTFLMDTPIIQTDRK